MGFSTKSEAPSARCLTRSWIIHSEVQTQHKKLSSEVPAKVSLQVVESKDGKTHSQPTRTYCIPAQEKSFTITNFILLTNHMGWWWLGSSH
ncbi:unnamed protein product [Prunus armeniaca]|uniref:Uncharacterized protein n=1 Tax=Prunus armeniaca TaxID=36596 RepID=A0A6J5UBR7_PRUAR|nr:unnamed protein product [Prunus armeniaca]